MPNRPLQGSRAGHVQHAWLQSVPRARDKAEAENTGRTGATAEVQKRTHQ